jgi:hypothetical protein
MVCNRADVKIELQKNSGMKLGLGAKLTKALRNGEVSEDLRLRIICELAQKFTQDTLIRDGHSKQHIADFIKTKPLLP